MYFFVVKLVMNNTCGYSARKLEENWHHALTRFLKSSNKILLAVPWTHLKLKGDQDFAVVGPRLWNSLPHEIREVTCLNAFKAGVKNDFLSLAFGR